MIFFVSLFTTSTYASSDDGVTLPFLASSDDGVTLHFFGEAL